MRSCAPLRIGHRSACRLTKGEDGGCLACGAVLGCLIDQANREVFVYLPQPAAEELESTTSVSGDAELPNFPLLLAEM